MLMHTHFSQSVEHYKVHKIINNTLFNITLSTMLKFHDSKVVSCTLPMLMHWKECICYVLLSYSFCFLGSFFVALESRVPRLLGQRRLQYHHFKARGSTIILLMSSSIRFWISILSYGVFLHLKIVILFIEHWFGVFLLQL